MISRSQTLNLKLTLTLKGSQVLKRTVVKALAVLKPPPDLTISDWADQNRRLSSEASAEPGQWRTSRAEYQRGIMDAISDPAAETVVIMSSSQIGKSESILNMVGYHIDHDPAPIMVVMPTERDAETWSKDRFSPMARDTPCLQGKIADPRSRDGNNKILHKRFPGGHLTIVGANAPSGLPHVAPAMVRLFLLDQYDDAELDRKKTAAMFAGFITKTAPEDPMMGEGAADLDGAAIASLEPGTMQVLLPGEDIKFSSPADVGGGYEAFQYRTLLAVSASLGLPYHLGTGDVRQANYSSLRAELVEFRRRIGQLQHGVMAHQLCRPIWRRWLETAVLSGALETDPTALRPVQWIPPRWDWVDPLKDIQAQVLAMEAGITSRRKVVEATGYDIEEVDRENAADAARVKELGLSYNTNPGETQGARATPQAEPDPNAYVGPSDISPG